MTRTNARDELSKSFTRVNRWRTDRTHPSDSSGSEQKGETQPGGGAGKKGGSGGASKGGGQPGGGKSGGQGG